jgi:hypothetical protein
MISRRERLARKRFRRDDNTKFAITIVLCAIA